MSTPHERKNRADRLEIDENAANTGVIVVYSPDTTDEEKEALFPPGTDFEFFITDKHRHDGGDT